MASNLLAGVDAVDLRDAIDNLVSEMAPRAFRQRDNELIGLMQSVKIMQDLADGKVPAQKFLSDSSNEFLLTNDPAKNYINLAGKEREEFNQHRGEILNVPYSVQYKKAGWWSIDLRRKGGKEVALYRNRGKARGRDCISHGRLSKEAQEAHYCDCSMTMDAFCQILHTKCPEFNLIDAYRRGRVKCTYFGEGYLTANSIISKLEKHFFKRLRGKKIDHILNGLAKDNDESAVRNALSMIFETVVGDSLESVPFWLLITDQIRSIVQFHISAVTTLINRQPRRVDNDSELQRIRVFRQREDYDEVMNPAPPPKDIIKREHNKQLIDKYQNSLKGRRRRRALENQSKRLRKEKIIEVMDLVLVDYDRKRAEKLLVVLNEQAEMEQDDAQWALKHGIPYALVATDLPLDSGRRLKKLLENAGGVILAEFQSMRGASKLETMERRSSYLPI